MKLLTFLSIIFISLYIKDIFLNIKNRTILLFHLIVILIKIFILHYCNFPFLINVFLIKYWFKYLININNSTFYNFYLKFN